MTRIPTRTIVALSASAAMVIGLSTWTGSPALAASGEAPGAPGKASNWAPGDKGGFGNAPGPGGAVWDTGRPGKGEQLGPRRQGRLRNRSRPREQGLVHAARRRAERDLLPAHRHAQHPRHA